MKDVRGNEGPLSRRHRRAYGEEGKIYDGCRTFAHFGRTEVRGPSEPQVISCYQVLMSSLTPAFPLLPTAPSRP